MVLAGGTRGFCLAPSQSPTLWASCLCLPATSNEVPEGTPCQRGTWGPALSQLSPWKSGSPVKVLVSGSQAVGVRLWLLRSLCQRPASKSWDGAPDPLDTPSLSCPALYALCGHGQWTMMEPGKGEGLGTQPHLGGFWDPCDVLWMRQVRVFELPLSKVGPCKPLLILSSYPIWALLPPGANLGTLSGCSSAFSSLFGPGSWVSPPS